MREWINGRPLTVVGLITALHSIVYGLGFLLLIGGFEKTALYENLDSTLNARWLGGFLLIVGLSVAAGLFARNDKLITFASGIQSFIWAVIFFIYALLGEPFLGVGTALVWAMFSIYVSYVHKNKELVLGGALRLYKQDRL